MSPGGRSSRGSSGGARSGSGQTGGGTRSPGSTKGGKKDDTTTPGAVTDLPEAGTTEFAPGQNGTLSWNTTQAIDRRPILVYVFDGHSPAGENFVTTRSENKPEALTSSSVRSASSRCASET